MARKIVPALPRRGPKPPSDATRFKQVKILELRKAGWTYQRIADEMGFSKLYVRKLFLRSLSDVVHEGVDDMRKLENGRMDNLFRKAHEVLEDFNPMVSGGGVVHTVMMDENGRPVIDQDGQIVTRQLEDPMIKLGAINTLLKIMERRAKMNGLDMPTKVANTDPTGEEQAYVGVAFYLPTNGRDVSTTPSDEPS